MSDVTRICLGAALLYTVVVLGTVAREWQRLFVDAVEVRP
ncbi:hypothetical protein AEGHOMDF_4656 [Methylobacterium soli]|nr:hypothetical protein AEGHOMDF_4656 [Methylobacterium soli]